MNPTSSANIEAVLGQIRNYQAQAQDGINVHPCRERVPQTALDLPKR